MVELTELECYLAELLDVAVFEDYCVNGVQIEGKPEINRILTGVSASARLFEIALDQKVDAVLLHHGLFWRQSPHPMALTGIMKKRVKLLLDADISLLGYHLPLDAHPEFGNNARISRALGLRDIAFVPVSSISNPIAAVGNLSKPMSFADFVSYIDKIMEVKSLG
jgi:putative NIF3 family GTP cyclohydrolase 1 type 2